MGEREALSAPDAGVNWQRELLPVLHAYLRQVGVASPEARAGWVAHVLLGMQMHLEEFAADDVREQAIERVRETIDARLARFTDLHPERDRREIAGILAMLGDPRHEGLAEKVFAEHGSAVDPATRSQLLDAITRDRPRPLPPPAPLAMPVQTIELRSVRALLRRLRGAE